MSTEPTNQIPSQEELEKRQSEVSAYYEKQIPFLKIQKEYETLITELEELELRRFIAQMKVAQIMAPPPKEEEQTDNSSKPRSLKKD